MLPNPGVGSGQNKAFVSENDVLSCQLELFTEYFRKRVGNRQGFY